VPAGGIGGGAGLRQRQLRKQVPASTIASSETANQRRSAYAAATGVARVRAAMGLLHDGTREHLLAAGRLRLEHPQASLEELGAFADPPMTKDAVAGRLRRLLAVADGYATLMGLPTTQATASLGLLEGAGQDYRTHS